jgi:hypothetical protein
MKKNEEKDMALDKAIDKVAKRNMEKLYGNMMLNLKCQSIIEWIEWKLR